MTNPAMVFKNILIHFTPKNISFNLIDANEKITDGLDIINKYFQCAGYYLGFDKTCDTYYAVVRAVPSNQHKTASHLLYTYFTNLKSKGFIDEVEMQ